MGKHAELFRAKEEDNDEFYTQLSDIENELMHYKKHFKDKVVFCNCDDPYESNFFKYFALNFNALGLKKLITTCYAGSPIVTEQLSLTDVKGLVINKKYPKQPYKIEITEVTDLNKDGAVDLADVEYLLKNKKNTLTLLKGDGDFRSDECVELLKESDIVVTNPPFSLFISYITQLIENDKKFIIMGKQIAISGKFLFPYLMSNSVWIGYGFNLSLVYKTPYKNYKESNRKEVIKKGFNPDDGYIIVPEICWFTNLDIDKRHEKMILFKKYTEQDYVSYDNFDGIDIKKVDEIPCDYFGKMGVPITFLNKHNPDQFKIIGLGSGNLAKEAGVKRNYRGRTDLAYTLNGENKCAFSRIIIQRIDGDEENGN